MISLSHAGSSVFSSSAPSRQVMVATIDGIITIEREAEDPAAAWRIGARALAGSHISSIIEPEPGLIFAGVFHGTVMCSRDAGKTWERRDAGIDQPDVYSLASVRVDGRLRLYAGTEPAHLYVSDDHGLKWRELPQMRSVASVPTWTFPAPPHLAHVKHITFAPDDPRTLYVSIEQGGVLKSSDGGESWSEFGGFDAEYDQDAHRLHVDPRDGRRMQAVIGMGIYATRDGGKSWERRTNHESIVGGYPDTLVYQPSNPDVMFAGGAKENPFYWMQHRFAGARITRSRDGGQTWELVRNGLPDPERWQGALEAMSLEEWGRSFSIFAATTAGEIYESHDGGDHWREIARLAPVSKGEHAHLLNAA
ncbi:MAG TPA: hypothetical protein VMD75_18190 [Candidatus Binataceae bacterium]|nr:hypothetical protein [Candidatus Binataceae bacterium]